MAISKIKGSAIQDATIPEDKLEDEAGSFRMILDGSDGSATDAGDFVLLDATASSTNVGEQFLFEPATDDGSAVLSGGDLKFDNVEILMDETSLMKTGGTLDQQIVIEQGLAKTFVAATLAAIIYQSFNISSSEDEGTGDYKYGVTNTFRISTARSGVGGCALGYTAALRLKTADATTAVIDIEMMNASFSAANADHSCVIHGDLA